LNIKEKITTLKSCTVRAHGATTLVPIDKPSDETQCIVQNDYAKRTPANFLAYSMHWPVYVTHITITTLGYPKGLFL